MASGVGSGLMRALRQLWGAGSERNQEMRMRGAGWWSEERRDQWSRHRGQKHVITNQSKQISSLLINYRVPGSRPGSVPALRLSSAGHCLITRTRGQTQTMRGWWPLTGDSGGCNMYLMYRHRVCAGWRMVAKYRSELLLMSRLIISDHAQPPHWLVSAPGPRHSPPGSARTAVTVCWHRASCPQWVLGVTSVDVTTRY